MAECMFLFFCHYHCLYGFIVETMEYINIRKEPVPIGYRCLLVCNAIYRVVNPFSFWAHIIRHLSFRQYIALLIVGAFLCLSIIPEFPFGKRFYVVHGNSVWCFAYLFMFAGFIRHYSGDFSKRKLLFFIALVVMLTAVSEMYMGCKGDIAHLFWFDYNGLPFILSIVMFIFIRQVNIPSSMLWNIMVKVAPYTFGIYLIHDHLKVRDWLWKIVSLTSYGQRWDYSLYVFILSLLVFVICTFVDAVRKKSFLSLILTDI